MSIETEGTSMSDGRALLTDREREALKTDESGSYRYKTRSYIRNRIERLEADAELLAEHEPELFEKLQSVVCDAVSGHESQRPTDGRESAESVFSEPRDESVAEPAEPTTSVNSGRIPEGAVDYPSGRRKVDCDEAIDAARQFLADEGRATKAEIVRTVMPDYPLGYDPDAALEKIDDGERYRGAWWRRVIKPGLSYLDDVEKPTQGASEWRYVGGNSR